MSENLIIQAAQMAHSAHIKQRRKYNDAPYIEHPMRVAGRLTVVDEVPEFAVAAAWLHDVKEDQREYWDAHYQELPVEVIELVEWLTNTPKSGEYAKLNRAARKAIDREKLSKAPTWARVIKCFDRLDNLMEMSREDVGFLLIYCDESLALFDALETNAGFLVKSLCVLGRAYTKQVLKEIPPKEGEVNGRDSASS